MNGTPISTPPCPQQRDLQKDHYTAVFEALRQRGSMTYESFDRCVVEEISLFDVPNDRYLKDVEACIDVILRALPALKRIFANPIIRLSDTREITPIEAVRVIDNASIAHAAFRSDLWESVTKKGIRPRKLMTVQYEETYAIYENRIFVKAIDCVLDFVRNALTRFGDVLYGCRDIHFNLLDRTHHSSYFLAIAKLHLEYARAQTDQQPAYLRCMEKLLFIERSISAKLQTPVYTACKQVEKKTTRSLKLKKTNTFRSHKDYKQVYRLLEYFESVDSHAIGLAGFTLKPWEYRAFCLGLSVFALGHFNFEFSKDARMDFTAPVFEGCCKMLGWRLFLTTKPLSSSEVILFRFQKEREYTVCILPWEKGERPHAAMAEAKQLVFADEYLFASPVAYGEKDVLYLSAFDVDSFRRIQQMVLRGMIYSDTAHKDCPFCKHELAPAAYGAFECAVCRAVIREEDCPETGKRYYLSSIKQFDPSEERWGEHSEQRKFLHDRYTEARFHFRNITAVTQNGRFVCPHCGKLHEDRRASSITF